MTGLNADYTKRVVMHTGRMAWQPSPSPTVWRKRLDLVGPQEAGQVTSVVRYDADSKFPPHDHPDGEEILVLDGVFSDEHGDYPAGTFLLNPEGFRHAPFSREGCVILVKLRQYPGGNRRHVVVDTNTARWDRKNGDVAQLALYEEAQHPETIHLWRMPAGAHAKLPAATRGAEVFLLSGDIRDDDDLLRVGDWIRYPPAVDVALHATTDSVLYVKTGHLPA